MFLLHRTQGELLISHQTVFRMTKPTLTTLPLKYVVLLPEPGKLLTPLCQGINQRLQNRIIQMGAAIGAKLRTDTTCTCLPVVDKTPRQLRGLASF